MYPESLPNCGCPDNTTPPVEAPAPPVCENGELCEEVINTQCVRYDGPNLENGINNEMNMTSIVQILSGVPPGSVEGAILKYVTVIDILNGSSVNHNDKENSVGITNWVWSSTGTYDGLIPSGVVNAFNWYIAGSTGPFSNQLDGVTVIPIVNHLFNSESAGPFLLGYFKVYVTNTGTDWVLRVECVDTNNYPTDITDFGINYFHVPELRVYT